jgi:AAA+ ATPase superfamily predicted ATPase
MGFNVIGRSEEKKILLDVIHSAEPELVAVYGRRRVGKTYLIRNFLEKQLIFEFSGVHNASLNQQLENFSQAMTKATGSKMPLAKPKNWQEAFKLLIDYTTPCIKKGKKVIFFDEFPWISTPKSGFTQAFEFFWNHWASRQKNLAVIICGSAAAWMISNIINNKGGLHNRVTKRIRLLPFDLQETELFLKDRKINLDRYQILQLYMAMGGIPHYLKEIKKRESATQSIDNICFSKNGLLNEEFNNLFNSLFDDAGSHKLVIKALANKGKGLTRKEIIETCKLTTGGGTTKLLDELIESGFISSYIPFGKNSKDAVYKLSDEYTLFYLKFIEHGRANGKGTWVKLSREAKWKSWSGIAFESICLKHTKQIKKALGIEGVYTETSGWRNHLQKDEKGAQIDLLIDRQDFCINICEMKFSSNEFIVEKKYADELENKVSVFKRQTKTTKTIFLTLVTTFGIKHNAYAAKFIQNDIKMDALFT